MGLKALDVLKEKRPSIAERKGIDKPLSPMEAVMLTIVQIRKSFQQKWADVQISALAPMLTDREIIDICTALNHQWRQSPFPPPAVVR